MPRKPGQAPDLFPNTHPQREAHMARRAVQGQTVRAIAQEFGTSKSAANRAIKRHRERKQQELEVRFGPTGNKQDDD